jgi:hypothetical protein
VLIIRDEQMKALREEAFQSFRRRIYEHLATLSGNDWTSDRIWQEADAAIAQAREFHLSREVDVARLAELYCMHLDGFRGALLPKEVLNLLYAFGVDPEDKLRAFGEWIQGSLAGSDRAR